MLLPFFLGLAVSTAGLLTVFFLKVRSFHALGNLLISAREKEGLAKKEELIRHAHDEKKNFLKDLERQQKRIEQKERAIKTLKNDLEENKLQLSLKEKQLEKEIKELKSKELKAISLLQRCSELTKEEALYEWKQFLLKEIALEKKRFLQQLENEKEELSRRILIDAMQKVALPALSETTLQALRLPNSAMKGRIIGREGRNARLFEKLTGVTLSLEEESFVILSSFDPERLYIAKTALTQLLQSGKFYPAKIEEAIAAASTELKNNFIVWGKTAAEELGVLPLHPELLILIGKLQLKTSQGQNLLQHSKETAMIADHICQRMGLSSPLAKRIALLHEIGQTADIDLAAGSGFLAKKYGVEDKVVRGVEHLNGGNDPGSLEAAVASLAKMLSSERPGARSASLASYLEKMERLEELAKDFPEVVDAYALRGGKELFVAVKPNDVSDEDAGLLARKIAFLIEKELDYHGKIKVVVSRESQVVQYAI